MATIKGKWVFKDIPKGFGNAYEYTNWAIGFTCNGAGYGTISVNEAAQLEVFSIEYDSTEVYNNDNGWINEAYRTVDFGSVEKDVNDIYYNWLSANATQQAAPEPEAPTNAVTAQYKSQTIAIEAGKTATLHTSGQKLTEDVVISVPKAESGGVSLDNLIFWIMAGYAGSMDTKRPQKVYPADKGSTWQSWVSSKYNTYGFFISGTKVYDQSGNALQYYNYGTYIAPTDSIIDAGLYLYGNAGGGAA